MKTILNTDLGFQWKPFDIKNPPELYITCYILVLYNNMISRLASQCILRGRFVRDNIKDSISFLEQFADLRYESNFKITISSEVDSTHWSRWLEREMYNFKYYSYTPAENIHEYLFCSNLSIKINREEYDKGVIKSINFPLAERVKISLK